MTASTYPCTFFIPPHAEQETHEITKIRKEEVEYFTEHNVKLSGEQLLPGQFVFYADHGALTEDGEPDECLIIVQAGERCEDVMHRLRLEVEKEKRRLANGN